MAHHFLSTRADNEPAKIVITQGDITSMVIGFSRTWQRPPTREELERLDPGSRARGSLFPGSRSNGFGSGRPGYPAPAATEAGSS